MIELHIAKGEHDSEIRLRFPATLDEVRSALSELEQYSACSGPARITHVGYPVGSLLRYIRCADLDSEANVQELNTLADRVNGMSQRELRIFFRCAERGEYQRSERRSPGCGKSGSI